MPEPIQADESPISVVITTSESRALFALSAAAHQLNPTRAARARMRRALITALRLAPELAVAVSEP